MNVKQLDLSRRTIALAAALIGTVSLVIGAHAALNMRAIDAAKAVSTDQITGSIGQTSRLALVIGNGHYPDASAPLTQSINDARALSSSLRKNGFDVDMVEDATKDDMVRAVGRLKSRIKRDTVVMLFFGGYGVQAGRESYMLPVDAVIWKESDVRRQGVSIDGVIDMMKEQGAKAKLVVVDASRRNPYERRFRSYSHGLAPISASDNALILSSASPGKVVDDGKGEHSVLVSEFLNNLSAKGSAESVFNKTRGRHLPRQRRRPGPDRLLIAARRRPFRRSRRLVSIKFTISRAPDAAHHAMMRR
ncbi:putative caspase-like protein [Bradyrhizobium ottawaense]